MNNVEGGDSLPRLPPGRHGLSRDFVSKNQQDRIAAGMIKVVVTEGYAAMTVSKVVAAAGVSRRTFYGYYSDKDAAYFDVYDQVTGFLCHEVAEAGTKPVGWASQVRARLAALLGVYAEHVDLVRFTLVAPPAAGGEVAMVYRAYLERLLAVLVGGRPNHIRKPPPAAAFGLIGGLAARVAAALTESGAKGVEQLLPEAVELVLAPYLGREAAIEAAA